MATRKYGLLNESIERLLHKLHGRGRFAPFAPWHLAAHEEAAAAGLTKLAGGQIDFTHKGRREALRRFGESAFVRTRKYGR